MARRYLTADQLSTEKSINYSKSQRNKLIREQKFPKPIPLSSQRRLWDEAEIDEYLERCRAAPIEQPESLKKSRGNATTVRQSKTVA
jgi:predicted DNA-binding transcriptional regulator AlpA